MPQPAKPDEKKKAALAVMIGLPFGPPKPPRGDAEDERKPGKINRAQLGSIYHDEVGYVSPDQRCGNCVHYGKDGRCAHYGFECEPKGGCPHGFSPRMDEEPAEYSEEEMGPEDEEEEDES